MVIVQMLDRIDDLAYKNFVSPIFNLVNKVAHPETSQEEVVTSLEKLDILLEVATPLISVQPVIITIGYLRCTFAVRQLLPHWPTFLEEAELQLGIKFKPEKVQRLLRGLIQTSSPESDTYENSRN